MKNQKSEILPCVFPFAMFDRGNQLFNKCIDIDINDPNDNRLICSTKTNPDTNQHILGNGDWGFCEEYCPADVEGIV